MADQFCRIVDTTICDMTLGSDASQVILTTDANTSYVIRDAYKTDECDSTSFVYTGELVLDGHPVAAGLATSLSGSVIIPPSSTLCYKDTSTNYPLEIKTLEIQGHGYAGCCEKHIGRTSCTVNDINDGAVTCNNVCIPDNVCCSGNGSHYLEFQWHDCNNGIFHRIHSDGNSTNILFGYCLSADRTTCRAIQYVFGRGYCGASLNGSNVVLSPEENKVIFWSPSFCGGICCCQRCFTFEGLGNEWCCGMTTYARSGISAQGSKPGTTTCYGWIKFPGGTAASPVTWGHADINCLALGEARCLQGGVVGSVYPSQKANTCICQKAYSSCSRFGVFYSLCKEEWLGWFWEGSAITFLEEGNKITEVCLQDTKYWSCSVSDDGRNFWLLKNCECKSKYASLDDLLTNQQGATWTIFEDYGPSGTNCWNAYGPNCCCSIAWIVNAEVNSTAKSCDRDIDPTAKLSLYGIKST